MASDTKVAQAPIPAPSPTPPPVVPVNGTVVEVATTDTSWNDQLGLATDGDPPEGAVEAAAAAVAAALDAHLDAAQRGTADLVPIKGVWLQGNAPEAAAVLTSGLTNPDNPVAAASYRFDVHLEPGPTLLVADIAVDRRDGTTVRVELVFDVSGDEPRLHLVGTPRAA